MNLKLDCVSQHLSLQPMWHAELPVAWFMPSNVDVMLCRNLFFPHIYDNVGFSMEILMNNLYVYFSFTGNNSYFVYIIGLIMKVMSLPEQTFQ
jgi:hypothetical protein